nr:kinesin-like protein KIN-12D [Tanacetum cinerariifolium]
KSKIATDIAQEQLGQRDHLLATENDMFKKEIANHKMKVIKLEGEVTKLSGQQNLQQRIHHHTKIKEENNALKSQNDELSRKLRRNDAVLIRVKEELAKERASSGKNSYYVETELQLEEKLKETEDERDRLAQKLAALCTNILKAAGVTGSPCDVTISMADEALEQFQTRVATLARELQDLQYKNRISNERVRLLEMMPQMADESQQTNSRVTRSPFLSTFNAPYIRKSATLLVRLPSHHPRLGCNGDQDQTIKLSGLSLGHWVSLLPHMLFQVCN